MPPGRTVVGLGRWLRRHWLWFAAAVAFVAVAAAVGSFAVEEPLRRMTEREMNRRMKGYTSHIGRLDFHPIGFAVDFRDVQLVQNADPTPPVMRIEQLTASVQWWALLHGKLVADFTLRKPVIYADRSHFETELRDPTPLGQHGWQDALQAMYPLKINEFRVVDGAVTYVAGAQARPLRLTSVEAVAHDIRNVRSAEGEYPSPVTVDAVMFDRGRIHIDGHADFLLEPYAGVKGHVEIHDVPLDSLSPVASRANVTITSGVVSGRGDVEYSPRIRMLWLQQLRVDGLAADYHYRRAAATAQERIVREGAEAAERLSNAPNVVLHVEDLQVGDANIGFVNESTRPRYRVFLDEMTLTIEKFSNQTDEGYGHATLSGRFVGSGATTVNAVFRPETNGPNFSVDAKIVNADMRRMNDLLRAYGKFDVVAGVFSVYAQMRVHDGRVEGYVKPLFRDLQAYSPEQDVDTPLLEKLREKAIDVASELLKNRPRQEVATVADVSGPLENPHTSTWQMLLGLVRNAFIKAVLPGFERQAAESRAKAG